MVDDAGVLAHWERDSRTLEWSPIWAVHIEFLSDQDDEVSNVISMQEERARRAGLWNCAAPACPGHRGPEERPC